MLTLCVRFRLLDSFFPINTSFYSLCGSLDMNSLDVLYEELAKDEDVLNDVDEEIDANP